MTYETLRKRQQSERGSPKLSKLDAEFYRLLEAYLQGLGEEHQREHGRNPTSAKSTLLNDELTNTRRLAEDLYEHRERKVVTAALIAARGGQPETHGLLLREEQELYEAIVALLRDTKRRILHGRPAAAPPAPPPAPVQAQGSPVLNVQPAPEAPAPAAAPEGRTVVRVLEDVGSFAASDLRTYVVRREDVVSLPTDTARILILRGKAVEVAASR